ncbi:hypothetical protein BG004_005155 [Podila humilis]|nr:hypothetical protein BG004_005155 [Podila humilis]
MKFAKYLQDETIPEWRKAYMNYKQGKKHLKAIERALAQHEKNLTDSPKSTPTNNVAQQQLQPQQQSSQNNATAATADGSATPVSPALTRRSNSLRTYHPTQSDLNPEQGGGDGGQGEGGTSPILAKGRAKNARSYSAITLSSTAANTQNQPTKTSSSPSLIVDDSRSLSSATVTEFERRSPTFDTENIPNLDTATTTTEPTTGPQSKRAMAMGGAVRKNSGQILTKLKRKFTAASLPEAAHRPRRIVVENNDLDSVRSEFMPEENAFFDFLDGQLQMVDDFYKEKELEAVTKLKVIKQQIFVANEWKRRYDIRIAKAEAKRRWYQAEWSKVREGLGNLMRADTMTEEVVIGPMDADNSAHAGVHPKSDACGFSSSPSQQQQHAASSGLRHRGLPAKQQDDPDMAVRQEQMIQADEEDRRQHLNHKVARTRIKTALSEFYRSLEMLKNYKALNATGFGKIMKKFDKTAGWKASKAFEQSKLMPTYFYSASVVKDLIVETEDLYIDTFEKGHRRRGMAKLRVPDSKNQIHHKTALRIGIYLGLAMPLLAQGVQSAFSKETQADIPYWDSLLLVYGGLFLTILFGCLFGINMKVWYKNKINYKFIFEFDPRDNLDYHEFFEIANYSPYCSDLALHCTTSHMWITPFATALPPWFRFMQCIRRFKDTAEWFPHLVNAGKYTASLVTLFVYFSFRHYGGNTLKAVYIVLSIFTSSYTFMWDVYMDWGLFRFGKYGGAAYGHPFLRPELVYSKKWVYYAAIVLDFVGRFSWVVRFMNLNVHVIVLSFSLALVEVLRRWMWNFFRLENEHLNNCGQFRAIKDIPLPFHIHFEGDDSSTHEESDEDDGGDQRQTGQTVSGTDGSTPASEVDGQQKSASKPPLPLIRKPSNIPSISNSVFSNTRRGSQAATLAVPDRPQVVSRSNTFVDDAMAEAGFNESQREELQRQTDTVAAKFFNRRDFDTKMDDSLDRPRTPRSRGHGARSDTGLGTSPVGIGASGSPSGLGLSMDGARMSAYDLPPAIVSSTPTRTKNIFGSRLFRRREDTDDDDEDEDDEDEQNGRR